MKPQTSTSSPNVPEANSSKPQAEASKAGKKTSLEEVLQAYETRTPLHEGVDIEQLGSEARGDFHASRGNWVEAYATYRKILRPSAGVRAKCGFSMAAASVDRFEEEAAGLLTVENVGNHPLAKAVLCRLLVNGTRSAARNNADERNEAKRLLREALEPDRPHVYVFTVAVRYGPLLGFSWNELEAIADRGLSFYPDWWLGMLRKLRYAAAEERHEAALLARALAHLSEMDELSGLGDLYVYASSMRDAPAMEQVIERLRQLAGPDAGDERVEHSLTELLAGAELIRGQAGEVEAFARGLASLGPSIAPERSEALKLALGLAVGTGRDDLIRDAAEAWLNGLYRHDSDIVNYSVDDWAPVLALPGWDDWFMPGTIPLGVRACRERILSLFDRFEELAIEAVFALDAVLHELASEDDYEILEGSAKVLPPWTLTYASSALLATQSLDCSYSAGLMIANAAFAIERTQSKPAAAQGVPAPTDIRHYLSSLTHANIPRVNEGVHVELVEADESVQGLVLLGILAPIYHGAGCHRELEKIAAEVEQRTGSAFAMFHLAQAAQLDGNKALAIERYERTLERDRGFSEAAWMLAHLYSEAGNVRGLTQLAKLFDHLVTTDHNEVLADWRNQVHALRAGAKEKPAAPQDPVFAALARFPVVGSNRWRPEDLSLVEAVTLVALLRSGEIDHRAWTLQPLAKSARPFESRNRLRATLFELARRGLIGFHPSTPQGTFQVREGQLYASLERVVWQLAPATLELEREIRQLRPSEWPDAWRAQVRRLSIDLGGDELVAYFEHILEERGLPIPNEEDVRDIMRGLLERVSIANAYYLAHKTARSALEYRAKYPVGEAQVMTRTLNLLRSNGEAFIEHGWDTAYQRIASVPASLMFEALHNVMTGWGERAFDQPIDELPLA